MQLGKIKRNFLLREILKVHLEKHRRKLQRKYEPQIKQTLTQQKNYLSQFNPLELSALSKMSSPSLYHLDSVRVVPDLDTLRQCQTDNAQRFKFHLPRISVGEKQFDFDFREIETFKKCLESSSELPYSLKVTNHEAGLGLFNYDPNTGGPNKQGSGTRYTPEWAEDLKLISLNSVYGDVLILSDQPHEQRQLFDEFSQDLRDLDHETEELAALVHEFLSDARTLKQVTDNWPSINGLIPDSWFQEESRRKAEAEERRKQQLVQEQLQEAKKAQGRETTGELLDSKLRSTIGASRLRGN